MIYYRILVSNPLGRQPLQRPQWMWKDITVIDVKMLTGSVSKHLSLRTSEWNHYTANLRMEPLYSNPLPPMEYL
jgi:hypothetical protein